MKKQLKKFLQFNGKNIYFLAIDGVYWIAIKPICEALGVDYIAQYKALKKDNILKAALSNQTMQVGNDQLRSWACLPEFFVYGWIFKMQSDSDGLEEYQWKCFELLYNYFHGAITERENILKVKTQAELEIEALELELQNSIAYRRIQELKKAQKNAGSELRKLDTKIVESQLELWKQEFEMKKENTINQ